MVGGKANLLWTATWNVGGLSADKMLEVLDAFGGSPELKDIQFVLLQEIITEPGLHHAESDSWQIVFGKMEGEFRGEGVAHTTTFSHHRSKVLPGAVLTQLRSKQGNLACTTIAGHIPHHATIAQAEAILSGWGDATQTRRAILGFDANETFTAPPSGRGCYATTGRGHAVLNWLTQEDYTIPPQQLHIPSYHPYNHSQQPRRIDYLATKHITAGEGKVLPTKDRAASDHDAVAAPVGTHKGGGPARTTWGPRRLRPEGQIQRLLAIPPPQKGKIPTKCWQPSPRPSRSQEGGATNSMRASGSSSSDSQPSKPRREQQQDKPGNSSPGLVSRSTDSGCSNKPKKQPTSTGEPCAPSKCATRTRDGTCSSKTTHSGRSAWGSTCKESSLNLSPPGGVPTWQPPSSS